MAEKTLIAKVHADEKDPDTLLVECPVVGMADGAPKEGLFLNPFDQIVTMKTQDHKFADQILFALEIASTEKVDLRVQWGKLPKVGTFGEFHQKFIMKDPPQRRNILV